MFGLLTEEFFGQCLRSPARCRGSNCSRLAVVLTGRLLRRWQVVFCLFIYVDLIKSHTTPVRKQAHSLLQMNSYIAIHSFS